MKIRVRTEEFRMTLFIPAFWILGSPLAHWILNRVGKRLPVGFPPLTAEQRKSLRKTLKRCKKQYKGLTLAEVESSNGDQVTITL